MSGEVRRHPAAQIPRRLPAAGRRLPGIVIALSAAAAWWLLYSNLERFANWLVHEALGMAAGSRLASAIAFFVRRQTAGNVLASRPVARRDSPPHQFRPP